MTRKIYRTAQGKSVDLGALQLRNENVRAVGNMSVNARGDLIDSHNRPIRSRNQQVAKQYGKQTTGKATESPVVSSRSKVAEKVPAPPEDFEDDFARPSASSLPVQAPAAGSGGLAAAIAKAREIRQDQVQASTNKLTKL